MEASILLNFTKAQYYKQSFICMGLLWAINTNKGNFSLPEARTGVYVRGQHVYTLPEKVSILEGKGGLVVPNLEVISSFNKINPVLLLRL